MRLPSGARHSNQANTGMPARARRPRRRARPQRIPLPDRLSEVGLLYRWGVRRLNVREGLLPAEWSVEKQVRAFDALASLEIWRLYDPENQWRGTLRRERNWAIYHTRLLPSGQI